MRPTMFMTNTIEWWSRSIKEEDKVYFPGGKGRVCPVDPFDVAAVASAVLTSNEHDGRAYDVTGPETLTIAEMTHVISRLIGKPIRYIDVLEDSFAQQLLQRGLSQHLVVALTETFRALRADRFAYVADTVERLTGRKARSFENWCRDNAPAFM